MHRSCDSSVHYAVGPEFELEWFDNNSAAIKYTAAVEYFPEHNSFEHGPADTKFNYSKPRLPEPDDAVEHFAIEHDYAVVNFHPVDHRYNDAAAVEC